MVLCSFHRSQPNDPEIAEASNPNPLFHDLNQLAGIKNACIVEKGRTRDKPAQPDK